MPVIIMAYDREFIVDIYVFAEKKDDMAIGAYEIICNGGTMESKVLKFPNTAQPVSCVTVSALQRGFIKAADIIGKYAIPLLDPNRDILIPQGKKIDGKKVKRLNAKFVFRFHIIDERAMSMANAEYTRGIPLSCDEEKAKNMFKLMRMKIARPRLPYRNLRVAVHYEFLKASEMEVNTIAELAKRELDYSFTASQRNHEQ